MNLRKILLKRSFCRSGRLNSHINLCPGTPTTSFSMHGLSNHSGSPSLFSLKVVKQFSIVFPLGCFFETKVYKDIFQNCSQLWTNITNYLPKAQGIQVICHLNYRQRYSHSIYHLVPAINEVLVAWKIFPPIDKSWKNSRGLQVHIIFHCQFRTFQNIFFGHRQIFSPPYYGNNSICHSSILKIRILFHIILVLQF